nr:putative glucose-6-phosphate 1-epimerase [Tanacetum cinerariifolium]
MIHPLTDFIREAEFLIGIRRNGTIRRGLLKRCYRLFNKKVEGGCIADWRLRWLGLPVRRNKLWTLNEDPSPLPTVNSQSNADLLLKSTEEDLKTWPFTFELRIRITVSAGKLTLVPHVRNVDNKAFTFTISLRNYFSVSNVSEVRVEGLETLDYLDNTLKRERYTEQADAITFDGEIDRVFLSTPTEISIIDHERKRTIVLRKEGMVDAVL